MTYGPWEDREDIHAPRSGKPFVIWHYYSMREGLLFVFEDQEGYQEYRLVHSNATGEVYSAEWVNLLNEELYKIY